ncbi:MAG: DciA family protein [Rugosibacter sp.]|nr:DciA family protein [Rugosibacter sp.]
MAKSLQEHLVSTEGLARLAAHAHRLLEFQRALETVLPDALRPHARVANFRLGKIFIHTSNSAVAAKVRQLGPRIAAALTSPATKVTEVGVSVQASPAVQPKEIHQRPVLPGYQQKQGLTLLAQNMPPESALKRALERLIKVVTE